MGRGYMLGNLDTHDRICRLLAQKGGWAVLHSFLHCSRPEPIAMQAIEDGAAFLRDAALR